MILAITYTSQATDLHAEEMRLKLMRECELRNVTQDVTGLLLYQEGHFLQYIEGEPETIPATMTSLCTVKKC
nr:BLUF domain-containing protein [uncultured Deefgea sp.]